LRVNFPEILSVRL